MIPTEVADYSVHPSGPRATVLFLVEERTTAKKAIAVTAISIATVTGSAAEMVRKTLDAMPLEPDPIGMLKYGDDCFEIYRLSDLPEDLPIDPAAGVELIQAGGTIAIEAFGS